MIRVVSVLLLASSTSAFFFGNSGCGCQTRPACPPQPTCGGGVAPISGGYAQAPPVYGGAPPPQYQPQQAIPQQQYQPQQYQQQGPAPAARPAPFDPSTHTKAPVLPEYLAQQQQVASLVGIQQSYPQQQQYQPQQQQGYQQQPSAPVQQQTVYQQQQPIQQIAPAYQQEPAPAPAQPTYQQTQPVQELSVQPDADREPEVVPEQQVIQAAQEIQVQPNPNFVEEAAVAAGSKNAEVVEETVIEKSGKSDPKTEKLIEEKTEEAAAEPPQKEVDISTLKLTDDPLCNSNDLRNLMLENIDDNLNSSKRLIQLAAEAQFGGRFDVICANGDFSYVTNTELFCQETKGDISCYTYRQL